MNLSHLFWILILVAVSLIVFLSLGARAKIRLKKQYPPIGQMVDMGGYRLHIHTEGTGTPTVVLDAGAGGIGLSWELVRPAIARVTRVVVYDRAGLGWSEPSPHPRDAASMAAELHTLLANAAVPGPYILVGHSLGGPVARHFAARYPDEVAGLVMVDSAHEQQVRYFPAPVVKVVNSMKGIMSIMKLMSGLGIFALKPGLISTGDNGKLPKELVAQMQAVMASSTSHAETLVAETETVYAAQAQPVSTLGDMPLTVISHGQLDANALPPSFGPQVREEYEQAWQKLQLEITSLSRRGKRVVAERSGHNIMFDQPEIIIEAIQEIWEQNQLDVRSSETPADLIGSIKY